MKQVLIAFAAIFVLSGQNFADVTKKSKSVVTFNKFGSLTTEQSIKITTEGKKWTDTKNKFKGKGLFKFAGKMFFKSGNSGELVDLPAMKIYNMNHKKKEYEVSPIEKLTTEGGEQSSSEEIDSGEQKEEKKEDGAIKIIRSEFKVQETGETKTINNFPSNGYTVLWLTEWQNTETGQKGLDSLFTLVWTTPLTDDLKQAQEEEMSFNQAYMKAIGIDMDQIQQEILGTNWLTLFQQMSEEEAQNPEQPFSKYVDEMKKIQGYPVVVDGKYYAIRPKQEQQNGEEEEEVTDIKKTFGRFGKKLLKKKSKKSDTLQPAFTYYTELIEFAPANFKDLQVPANYKMKK
jgi:hypothetical protein